MEMGVSVASNYRDLLRIEIINSGKDLVAACVDHGADPGLFFQSGFPHGFSHNAEGIESDQGDF